MYRVSCIFCTMTNKLHNYFINYHTPTCFDSIVSSLVTQVFQMQLLVMQFTI